MPSNKVSARYLGLLAAALLQVPSLGADDWPEWRGEGRLGVWKEDGIVDVLELSSDAPAARKLWQGKSSSEVDTDGLHALMTTPVIRDGVIYGVCSYGQLRALDLETGERLWESLEAVGEKARWAAAFIVRHGERYFINNDRGELILARLERGGYREIDRTELIEPTSPASRRRSKGAVHWSHPAYANRHVVVRNDREIVRADLGRAAPAGASRPGIESSAQRPTAQEEP